MQYKRTALFLEMSFVETLVSILYVSWSAAYTFSLFICYDHSKADMIRTAASLTAAVLALHLSLLVLGATAPQSVVEGLADAFGNYGLPAPYAGLSDTLTTMAMFADAAQLYVAINLSGHLFYRHNMHGNDDKYLISPLVSAASVGLLSNLFCGAKNGEEIVWALQALMLVPAGFYIVAMGAQVEKRPPNGRDV
jgi:hypothetical protein